MDTSPKARGLPLAAFVPGLAAFCIGTTEVMVSGLLPMLSRDLNISIPTAGLPISGYAAGVVVGGPILTLAFLKTPRKKAALILVGLFVTGQALGAIAPNDALLMASRVLAALARGALFGFGCFIGTIVGGRFTDRYLRQTLCLGLAAALALTMAAFALLIGSRLAGTIALAALGVAAFSIKPALQAQVINEAESAPTLATTTNTSAFNVGNTIGPWLGGVAITAGWGFTSAVWVGAALVTLALCIALVTARRAMNVGAAKAQRSQSPQPKGA